MKKPPAKKSKKIERVELRAASEDVKSWKVFSKKQGFDTLSSFIRALLEDAIASKKAPTPSTFVVEDGINHAKIYHLARIGNNLNQIAYAANKAAREKQFSEHDAKEIAEELMFMNIQLSSLLQEK